MTAGNGSFGRDGRKVLVGQGASATTIEQLLQRLTVPVNEVKPLVTALRSDGWKSYQKVTDKLRVLHYRAILSYPKDSMTLPPGRIAS